MHSSVFTQLLLHSKLLDAVQDIMETPNILLHHTKAHLKPPGKGAPFPMHQDYHYFPYEKDSMVAVFLHLDDTTAENGGLSLVILFLYCFAKVCPIQQLTFTKIGPVL